MEARNERTAYVPSEPLAYPKGPFCFELTARGDTIKITEATGALHTYVYMPTCPSGYHLVWGAGGLMCVRD
jgi:hypothetical protein